MRSLVVSNFILIVKESFMSLFEEIKRKVSKSVRGFIFFRRMYVFWVEV